MPRSGKTRPATAVRPSRTGSAASWTGARTDAHYRPTAGWWWAARGTESCATLLETLPPEGGALRPTSRW
jgi:hypothetical protein